MAPDLTTPRWRLARTVLFAVVGALVAVTLAARTTAAVGPFDCSVVARPALHGGTTVRLAPLGTIEVDTHSGPISLELRVDELRPDEAERIAVDPSSLEGLDDELAADAQAILVSLIVRALVAALLGGVLGALAARLRWQDAVAGAVAGLGVVGAITSVAALTFRPEAIAEPRYTGLLTVAPRAVGDVEALVERFDDYREQLAALVGNVVTIYRAAEDLPVLDPGDDAIRVLHVSDLHNNPTGYDLVAQLAEDFEVDVVVDTGDITDWGTTPEARLVDRVDRVSAPYVFVRGNHDSRAVERALIREGATVLDDEAVEVAGLRIWGIGDPRFTPDQREDDAPETQLAVMESFATEVDGLVADADPDTLDLVAVHDPRAAADLGGDVPLVLSGHRHRPEEIELDGTLVLVEGSTGGAGLRGLQGEDPTPLSASVLYLDPEDRRLVAYDRITVEGFGGSTVRIERHVVERPAEDER